MQWTHLYCSVSHIPYHLNVVWMTMLGSHTRCSLCDRVFQTHKWCFSQPRRFICVCARCNWPFDPCTGYSVHKVHANRDWTVPFYAPLQDVTLKRWTHGVGTGCRYRWSATWRNVRHCIFWHLPLGRDSYVFTWNSFCAHSKFQVQWHSAWVTVNCCWHRSLSMTLCASLSGCRSSNLM